MFVFSDSLRRPPWKDHLTTKEASWVDGHLCLKAEYEELHDTWIWGTPAHVVGRTRPTSSSLALSTHKGWLTTTLIFHSRGIRLPLVTCEVTYTHMYLQWYTDTAALGKKNKFLKYRYQTYNQCRHYVHIYLPITEYISQCFRTARQASNTKLYFQFPQDIL